MVGGQPQSIFAYQRRLIWWTVLPFLLALSALAADNVYLLHADRAAEVRALASRVASEVDSDLRRRIHGLQALGATSTGALRDAPLSTWQTQARSYDAAFNAPVLLANARREMLLHSREPLGTPLPHTPPPKGRAALDEALRTGQPAVGDLIPGLVLRTSLFAIAVPLPGRDPPLAWLASVPVTLLQPLVQAPEGWHVTLFDSMGDKMARSTDRAPAEPVATSSARAATQVLSVTPWRVQVIVDPWVFHAPQLRRATALLVGLLLTGVVVVTAARAASRRIGMAVTSLVPRVHMSAATSAAGTPRASRSRPAELLEVEAVRHELSRLNAAVEKSREVERTRVARELHDGLQQNIAGVKMMVDLVRQHEASPAESARLLDQASEVTQDVIEELHHIINDLRPPALDHLGLIAALEQLGRSVGALTGLAITVESTADPDTLEALPADVADCMFRLVQECLNNVRKHARASLVRVEIALSDPRTLVVQVSDDGVGIDADAPARPGSFGHIGMRQRVSALGGTLEIRSDRRGRPSSGTIVRAAVPLGRA